VRRGLAAGERLRGSSGPAEPRARWRADGRARSVKHHRTRSRTCEHRYIELLLDARRRPADRPCNKGPPQVELRASREQPRAAETGAAAGVLSPARPRCDRVDAGVGTVSTAHRACHGVLLGSTNWSLGGTSRPSESPISSLFCPGGDSLGRPAFPRNEGVPGSNPGVGFGSTPEFVGPRCDYRDTRGPFGARLGSVPDPIATNEGVRFRIRASACRCCGRVGSASAKARSPTDSLRLEPRRSPSSTAAMLAPCR
jgi:hypothetical protein